MLMAIWWITEAIPLAITSLLPVALFPAFGVLNGKTVSSQYFNWVIFLFIGGFIVALAMQRWNLHKRIALGILRVFGMRPAGMLLGFMVATWFLSMWISNTATAMMMAPIALAIIINLEESIGKSKVHKYSVGVFLGVAYSASIGGIATLVGTPPNMSFARILTVIFPHAPEISFAEWFFFAFPASLVFLLITWGYLYFTFRPDKKDFELKTNSFQKQYKELGPITFEEVAVLIVFVSLAVLWIFRKSIDIGDFHIPGWSLIFPNPKYINDGTVAIFMAIILFLIPSKAEPGKKIMDWETAAKLPWNIVLLFGGGFALAKGFKESGLAMWMGGQLDGISSFSPLAIVAAICLLATFLTELTSNTATAEMLLPALGSLAVAIKVNPLLLMIPGTLACSMAFMLPVATPPNAIIFGTQRVKIWEMAKAGFMLNLIGVVIVTFATWFLGGLLLDIDIGVFPDWATME